MEGNRDPLLHFRGRCKKRNCECVGYEEPRKPTMFTGKCVNCSCSFAVHELVGSKSLHTLEGGNKGKQRRTTANRKLNMDDAVADEKEIAKGEVEMKNTEKVFVGQAHHQVKTKCEVIHPNGDDAPEKIRRTIGFENHNGAQDTLNKVDENYEDAFGVGVIWDEQSQQLLDERGQQIVRTEVILSLDTTEGDVEDKLNADEDESEAQDNDEARVSTNEDVVVEENKELKEQEITLGQVADELSRTDVLSSTDDICKSLVERAKVAVKTRLDSLKNAERSRGQKMKWHGPYTRPRFSPAVETKAQNNDSRDLAEAFKAIVSAMAKHCVEVGYGNSGDYIEVVKLIYLDFPLLTLLNGKNTKLDTLLSPNAYKRVLAARNTEEPKTRENAASKPKPRKRKEYDMMVKAISDEVRYLRTKTNNNSAKTQVLKVIAEAESANIAEVYRINRYTEGIHVSISEKCQVTKLRQMILNSDGTNNEIMELWKTTVRSRTRMVQDGANVKFMFQKYPMYGEYEYIKYEALQLYGLEKIAQINRNLIVFLEGLTQLYSINAGKRSAGSNDHVSPSQAFWALQEAEIKKGKKYFHFLQENDYAKQLEQDDTFLLVMQRGRKLENAVVVIDGNVIKGFPNWITALKTFFLCESIFNFRLANKQHPIISVIRTFIFGEDPSKALHLSMRRLYAAIIRSCNFK